MVKYSLGADRGVKVNCNYNRILETWSIFSTSLRSAINCKRKNPQVKQIFIFSPSFCRNYNNFNFRFFLFCLINLKSLYKIDMGKEWEYRDGRKNPRMEFTLLTEYIQSIWFFHYFRGVKQSQFILILHRRERN